MKSTILLVDDNEDILDYLSNCLHEKYIVLTAHDGREALDKLHTETIHLVISDVMMPVMDGKEFLAMRASVPRYSEIPVIVVSAFSDRAHQLKEIQGFVKKPIDIDQLLKYLEQLSKSSKSE